MKPVPVPFTLCLRRFRLPVLLAFLAGASLLPAAPTAGETRSVVLRGLGKLDVTARFQGDESRGTSWITFRAEDAAHAAACGSKLLADLTGFGDLRNRTDTKLPGTVLELEGTGWWLLGLDGTNCQVLFARSREDIKSLADSAKGKKWQSVPRRAYPRWLDRFDNDAISMGVLGWGILPQDVNQDMQWIAEHGFAITASGFREDRMVAPGVFDFAVFDWYRAVAKKYDTAYNVYLSWASPERPKWVWNQIPLPHVIPADASLAHPSIHYQRLACYGEFEPVAATDGILAASRAGIATHLATDPRFNTHFGSPELGHNVLLGLTGVAGMPETQAAWREYLRGTLGFDLPTVGRLYRGDDNAFAAWSDVGLPGLQTFVGWDPATCTELRGEWVAKADRDSLGTDAKWFAPDAKPEGWTAIRSDDPLLLLYATNPKTSFWLKRTFTVDAAALTARKFLHISMNCWHGSKTASFEAYLNGKPLQKLTNEHPITGDYDQCYELGDALTAGENLLVLNTFGSAVPGYIFLGPTGRWSYPSDNPRLNRLWFDLTEFAASLRVRSLENSLKAHRAADPEGRPQLIMAPWDFVDLTLDLCEKYGAFPHDTGQGAACWAPWMARYYPIRGTPISSEPGNAPHNAREMRQMITLYLMLGNDSINALFHPTQYRDVEDISAWITANRELLKCAGKMELAPPAVGVLRSVRNASRLHLSAPWGWDLGRGELQAVGRTFAYADLPDVVQDRITPWCRVLFDAGTELLTDAEVAGLERFVQAGGVFVAMHGTGRHSPAEANAWPISRLTGLRVVGGNNGKLRFTETQKLWPSLKKRELDSDGIVLDWVGRNQTGESLAMESLDREVQVVAEWVGRKEGDGRIAIATRRIGKGMVVTLGASFWRSAKDEAGRYTAAAGYRPYLAELLDNLGVPAQSSRDASEAAADVFAEPWRSKNGIYDLYTLAKINSKAEPATFSVTFNTPQPPTQLCEISASDHRPTQFTPTATGFSLHGVTLDGMQTRIYAAPRRDLARAPLFWLSSLEKRWHALPPVPAAEAPVPVPPSPFVLPLIEGWTLRDGGDAWGDTPPAEFAWNGAKTVKLGSFAAMGLADDAVAHFRKQVTLPAAWQGRRVSLILDAEYWFWGVEPRGRLWVNGKLAPVPQPLGSQASGCLAADVAVEAGKNTLIIELEVDGRLKPGQRRQRPSGVLGALYLQADPQPVAVQDLSASLRAATSISSYTPAEPGKKTKYIYLESRFSLPATVASKRVFLESPVHLGWLLLNGRVVSTPGWMRRLDVSGLVREDGGENVLRWCPQLIEDPSCTRLMDQVVPTTTLAWWPDGQ